MFLSHLNLQNFRSYTKSQFEFGPETTYVVGVNTAGKSNLIEAIFFLATGKSFRAEKDMQAIQFGKEIARVKGRVESYRSSSGTIRTRSSRLTRLTQRIDAVNNKTELEVMLTNGLVMGKVAPLKKYLVNGVPKRRVDFAGHLFAVLFAPSDLEIIIGSPGQRRRFLDAVLEQVDRDYRLATTTYEKALRQRNALLYIARESGQRNAKEFEYWDELLIKNGQTITKQRQEFINYINEAEKDIFDCRLIYDKSVVSEERLVQYKDAELGSGVTLVGPHRDDVLIQMKGEKEVKTYASRGQQRLVILQLKLLQLTFMEQSLGFRPLLLLDDIFSELDSGHIQLVMDMTRAQQTIVTTTHEEFIGKTGSKESLVVKLG